MLRLLSGSLVRFFGLVGLGHLGFEAIGLESLDSLLESEFRRGPDKSKEDMKFVPVDSS